MKLDINLNEEALFAITVVSVLALLIVIIVFVGG